MVKSSYRIEELQRGMVIGAYPIRSESFTIAKRSFVLVRCECGAIKSERTDHLDRQNQCRCSNRIRGLEDKRHPLYGAYRSWGKMKDRVLNENHAHHDHYGGRGIKICDEWLNSFEAFARDMGPRPDGLTLDRIDNDGDYTPENCKWSTMTEQNRNKTNGRLVTIDGVTASVTELCEMLGMDRELLYNRLNRGWSVEAALTYPKYPRRRYAAPPQEPFNSKVNP